MSGGSNQQYPPMGGGMGGGPQSGGPPMITGGPYQGPPQGGGGWGGGQGDPNRPVPAVMPPGWQRGEQGGGSWNGPAPPGFTHGGGAATMALEEFINPTTGQKWTTSHGGYQPPPGWQRVGGGGFQAKPGGGMGGGMRGGFGNWAGLGKGFSEDQFMKARSFADRGKMGRAKQAIEQGGGQWSDQLHGLLGSPSGRWGNMGWDTMA